MPRKPKPPPPVVPCAVASSTDVHTATVLLVAHCTAKPRHTWARAVCDDHGYAYEQTLSACPTCGRPIRTVKATAL